MDFIKAEEALKIYDQIHQIEETRRAIEFEKHEAERQLKRAAKVKELVENHQDVLAAIDLAIRKDIYGNEPDVDLEKHLSKEMFNFILSEEWYIAVKDFLREQGFWMKVSNGTWNEGKRFFHITVKYK